MDFSRNFQYIINGLLNVFCNKSIVYLLTPAATVAQFDADNWVDFLTPNIQEIFNEPFSQHVTVCVFGPEPANTLLCKRSVSTKFSVNSEGFASELSEDRDERLHNKITRPERVNFCIYG